MSLSFFNLQTALTTPSSALAMRARPAEVPAEATRKASEKLMYCQRVVRYAYEYAVSEPVAAAAVAMHPDEFPLLAKCGKGGASALNYTNYRHWIQLVGRNKDRSPNASNLSALIEGYYGRDYRRPGNEIFWQTLMRMYLNDEQMPLSKAYKMAVEVVKGSGIKDIPTHARVRYYIARKFPEAARAAARRGDTWAENRLGSYVRRDWSSLAPNQVWVGDHHVLDCFVKYFDEETQKWKVGRPWLTAWVDIRSLYFVGFEIGLQSPNAMTILRALAVGYCATQGQGPQTLYSDNGKDFRKLGFAEPVVFDGHEHSVVGSLGVNVTYSLPYRGRSKPIERIFKEVAQGFCKAYPSYLGSNIGERPEHASYFESHPEDAPDLEQIQQDFMTYIFDVYHQQPQSGKIVGADDAGQPMSPSARWAQRMALGRNWEHLPDLRRAFQIPLPKTRQVGQGYCLRILGKDYRAEGENMSLHGLYKKDVMIKADTFSGEYYAYDPAGRLLCKLVEVPTVQAMFASYDDDQAKLLSEEMSRGRRDIKWAKSIALSETGLPVLISASEAVRLLETGAYLEVAGSKSSVKGSTHKYTQYRVVVPGETATLGGRIEASWSESAQTELPALCPPETSDETLALVERLKALKREKSEGQEGR